jgi:hypothetical protein
MHYKFRLAPTSAISKDIQKRAVDIARARVDIAKLNQDLNLHFEELKKANIELTKLSAQKVELKEAHPTIKDMDAGKKAAIKEISAIARHDAAHILNEIDAIISDLKRIILDADTILYRESKALDKFHAEITKLADKNLAAKLASQVSILKEELKTAARRLYELVKDPELTKKPFSKERMQPVSKNVIQLSKEVAELENLLEKLNITNLDEITKDAEKELNDLKKIEISIVSLVPELESHLTHIRSKLYLLEKSAAGRLEERLSASEKKLKKALDKIAFLAEKLFEEIVITEKI